MAGWHLCREEYELICTHFVSNKHPTAEKLIFICRKKKKGAKEQRKKMQIENSNVNTNCICTVQYVLYVVEQ